MKPGAGWFSKPQIHGKPSTCGGPPATRNDTPQVFWGGPDFKCPHQLPCWGNRATLLLMTERGFSSFSVGSRPKGKGGEASAEGAQGVPGTGSASRVHRLLRPPDPDLSWAW